jgi:hypothetical protein
VGRFGRRDGNFQFCNLETENPENRPEVPDSPTAALVGPTCSRLAFRAAQVKLRRSAPPAGPDSTPVDLGAEPDLSPYISPPVTRGAIAYAEEVRVRDQHAIQAAADKIVDDETARVEAEAAAASYVNPIVEAVREVRESEAIVWRHRFQAVPATTAFVPRTHRVRRSLYAWTTDPPSGSEEEYEEFDPE